MRTLWVLILIVPTLVRAQPPASIAPGDRVRVFTTDHHEWITGTLRSSDGEHVEIDQGDSSLSIARRSIDALEVSMGEQSRVGRGALWGACVGGGIGVIGSMNEGGDSLEPDPFALVAVCGAAGAVLGALVGAFIHEEEWQSVPLTSLSLVPSCHGDSITLVVEFQWR